MNGPTRFLTISTVSKLCGFGEAAVRKASEEGRLAVAAKTSSGERLFHPVDVIVFSLNRRFGLTLKALDANTAEYVADAISKASRQSVADAYGLIEALCLLLDERGRRSVSAAIAKFLGPPVQLPAGRATSPSASPPSASSAGRTVPIIKSGKER